MAAQYALVDVPLKQFLQEALVPYEQDEVTRLILDTHDAAAFAPISHFTVGALRDWLLSEAADTATLQRLAPSFTPEMVAAVSKLLRNQELIGVARRCEVVTRFRNTLGLRGRLATRLQPNHPTDDARGVAASLIDGLLYGSGDAVYSTLDVPRLTAGLTALSLPMCAVRSRAETREQYLQRPDYGRQLAETARKTLQEQQPATADIALILADGLSATAMNEHALLLLHELLPKLRAAGFRLAPVVLAEQARVALSDKIGELLGARLALMLIGERPGLSAPHSLGAYLTYAPRPGRTDEARNCVSNIRPEGLPCAYAADKLFYLVQESLRRQLSGVALKDNAGLLE